MTIAWRDGEPRLTGPGVARVTFPKAPWNRKGYDQDEVDAFLARVAEELARRDAEAAGLRDETARLRRRFVQRDGTGEWLDEETHAMAVAAYAEVQATVDRYVADAQAYCARLAGEAASRLEAAQAEAERVLADAREQAKAAAGAALDLPVPDPAAGPLRAERAKAAYQGTFDGVYLNHVGLLVDTLQAIISDWRYQQEPAAVPEPDAAEPQPAG